MNYSHTKTMEIRGIRLDEIITYFEQISGSKSVSADGRSSVESKHWYVDLLPEESFTFMHSDIPVVHFTIFANDQAVLDDVIKAIRLKTFRAGG
ncbi:hypothetical protein [Salisediminibacterium halotolerans]|uniref:Molybdopterin cofactor biosynthesis MoaD-related C-terminal domain-containing protein n=1 Tax=Salisediminibacterium halotolerans TaxID=517425 RepID=A0A1H9PBB4_9BACI|nr:hypothetical protein [Salisediminibacterium haloalkalitolerans]SER45432.1 hypothetical protein SAMN05444126_101147 [Salisediminibacterium haloalkalitolerans]